MTIDFYFFMLCPERVLNHGLLAVFLAPPKKLSYIQYIFHVSCIPLQMSGPEWPEISQDRFWEKTNL